MKGALFHGIKRVRGIYNKQTHKWALKYKPEKNNTGTNKGKGQFKV
jgi:hypothetical protein